jgi:hypothetical protein
MIPHRISARIDFLFTRPIKCQRGQRPPPVPTVWFSRFPTRIRLLKFKYHTEYRITRVLFRVHFSTTFPWRIGRCCMRPVAVAPVPALRLSPPNATSFLFHLSLCIKQITVFGHLSRFIETTRLHAFAKYCLMVVQLRNFTKVHCGNSWSPAAPQLGFVNILESSYCKVTILKG